MKQLAFLMTYCAMVPSSLIWCTTTESHGRDHSSSIHRSSLLYFVSIQKVPEKPRLVTGSWRLPPLWSMHGIVKSLRTSSSPSSTSLCDRVSRTKSKSGIFFFFFSSRAAAAAAAVEGVGWVRVQSWILFSSLSSNSRTEQPLVETCQKKRRDKLRRRRLLLPNNRKQLDRLWHLPTSACFANSDSKTVTWARNFERH